MKEGQWYHAGNAAPLLERRLKKLAQAGGAIMAVTHCLNEVETKRGALKDQDDFNYLSLVESPDLYDALELLGDVVKREANDICKRFGIPRSR